MFIDSQGETQAAWRLNRPNTLLLLTISAMILVQLVSLRGHWADVQAKRVDFGSLYAAGKVAREGTADYGSGKQHWVAVEPSSTSAYPLVDQDTLHPPFETLIFAPLSLLSYTAAYLIWFICNLVLLWTIPLNLWPYISGLHRDFHFIAILIGSTIPVSTCLIFGQDAILLLFLLTLTYVSMEQNKMMRAGVFLGLGLFKFQLVLPIVAILCAARAWRIVSGFLLTLAGLIGASVAFIGVQQTLNYFIFLTSRAKQVSINVPERTSTMPNIRGLVSLALGNIASSRLQTLVVIVISIAIFGVVFCWTRGRGSAPLSVRFAVYVTLASLVSYYYFVYNSVILILPLLLFASELENHSTNRSRNYSFAVIAVSIYLVPILTSLKVGMFVMAFASLMLLALLLTYKASTESVATV